MVKCVIVSCNNSSNTVSKKKNGTTFHRLPRDMERRRKWKIAINREVDWASTSTSSRVCSEHFYVEDFYVTKRGLRRVSKKAVPRIKISTKQTRGVTLSVSDTEEVVKLKRKVRRLEVLVADIKRRLNLMWQSKRRLWWILKQLKD